MAWNYQDTDLAITVKSPWRLSWARRDLNPNSLRNQNLNLES